MMPSVHQTTEQGYDLQFGTNVLGHYYFTTLLLPALLEGVKTSGDGTARVVNTSSSGHMFKAVDFNALKDGPARRRLGKVFLYVQSKYVSYDTTNSRYLVLIRIGRETLYLLLNLLADMVIRGLFPHL